MHAHKARKHALGADVIPFVHSMNAASLFKKSNEWVYN